MRFILVFVVGVGVVVGGVAIVYAIAGRGEAADQPIAFNHAVHLDSAGLKCNTCHTEAATQTYAGIPGKELCLDCHDVDEESDDAGPQKEKLFAFVDADGDIPWQRVALTKPDVYFSHRRHVTGGNLDCETCHPAQATLTAPPPRTQLVMTMDDCIACHEREGASVDCLACHR